MILELPSRRQPLDLLTDASDAVHLWILSVSDIHTRSIPHQTDGVILVDPEYVKDRKVFGNVLAAFRYGREDLDVLGLTFRKDLYLAHEQVYPRLDHERPMTRLQERLIKKLGPHAYPFYFEVPPHCPASVSLQPAPGDTGKPCGVDYELKAFVGEQSDDKPHKRNSVRLAIRKIMYAPSKVGEQPSIEVSKEFMMKPNKIHLEASLDKEVRGRCGD